MGFALLQGSLDFLHLASMRCWRVFSDILKLSSLGPIGKVISMSFSSNDSVDELELRLLLDFRRLLLTLKRMMFVG